MIILHTYTYGDYERQFNTLIGMLDVTRVFSHNVASRAMLNHDSYWKALLYYWGREEIVNVERDIEVDAYYVNDLARCKQPACAYAYRLGPDRHSSLFRMIDGKTVFSEHDPKNPPTSYAGSSIGLSKISLTVQRAIPLSDYPVDTFSWWYLDTWLSERMTEHGFQWHVHAPEVHHYDSANR